MELYIGRGERTGVVVVLWWLMGVLGFCKFVKSNFKVVMDFQKHLLLTLLIVTTLGYLKSVRVHFAP